MNKNDDKLITPGTPAPESGQYEVMGPRGGSQRREVTVVEGKALPPTPKPGQEYK